MSNGNDFKNSYPTLHIQMYDYMFNEEEKKRKRR